MLIDVNDIELYYEIHGEGAPLIMINGFGSSSEMWSPFWKKLLDSYQVILFDNRGTGRSSKPNIEYTIKMMADDVIGLMDALDIPKAHILGASMGGMIAQELVLNHPKRVESLILGMTYCGGPQSIPVSEDVQRKIQITSNPPPNIPMEEVMGLWWSIIYTPSFIAENRDKLIKEAMSIKYPTPVTGKLRHAQAVQGWEGSYDRLPQIRVPTLIMTGEYDALIPPENARILAERIPGAELQVFKDAGHAFTREKEGQVVALILDFLKNAS